MEPEELTPSPREEEALRDLAGIDSPELPDAGFTARVLASLPPPRARRPLLPQPWIVEVGSSLLGLGFALWRGATWGDALAGITAFGNALLSLCTQIVNPWVLVALGLSTVSVLIAFGLTRRGGLLG